jgi:hypothetical protein
VPHRWIKIAGFAVLIFIGGVGALLARRWPFSRDRITRVLEEKFPGTVEFKTFHSTYFTAGCVAEGVTFRRTGDRKAQPFATVQKLTIQGGYIGLFTTPKLVGRVRVEGLHVLVPPRSERTNARDNGMEQSNHATQSALMIGEIIADGTVVEFVTDEHPAGSLQFDFHELRLESVANERPMSFRATLRNPEPPGELHVEGRFGPMRSGAFNQTALSGSYRFQHADLGVFPGIAGTLSSDGQLKGVIERIDVQGATDTPDFQVKRSGYPVHLSTQFHVIVNGTDGNVILQSVRAQFEKTLVESQGQISGTPGKKGKTVSIDATETEGRIEDWLRLLTKADRPDLTGSMKFSAKVVIPPERRPFIARANLQGDFAISRARFTRAKTQKSVNKLSQRAEGEKEDDDPESVVSDLKGHVVLKDGTATFSTLSFSVPGALAQLHGTYGLLNERVNLHGTLRLDEKLSKGSKGIKSFLLKALEPFLKKKRSNEVVPVKLTGTYTHPSYGIEYRPLPR